MGPFSFPETHLDPPNKTQHEVDAHASVFNLLQFFSNSYGFVLLSSQNPLTFGFILSIGEEELNFISLLK